MSLITARATLLNTIALVGNPNSGKTTLFNALTGGRQRVGNWPGVTVERKSGSFAWRGQRIEIVDLPGIYSLVAAEDNVAADERIASEFILSREANVLVNILDASRLERSLYLTLQLIEMRVPMVVALNMMDVAREQRIHILADELSCRLNCPVIMLEATRGKGIQALKQALVSLNDPTEAPHRLAMDFYPDPVKKGIDQLARTWAGNALAPWLAMRSLEGDMSVRPQLPVDVLQMLPHVQQKIRAACGEDADILLADARYRSIRDLTACCVVTHPAGKPTWTARIDRVVLNRFLGIPIFLGIMYLMFFFSINIGGAFQDFFDIGSNTIFVEGLAHLLTQWHYPSWLIALLAHGVGKGINTTVTFIPVMGALFLFLAFLEDSGYMARAAFVVDRLMRALGLPGKSFVPMIVGFGCNVPAVMAARTLESPRDRVLTVLMAPFMSCGARLAIYAVFTAAFFPTGGQNIIFMLYLIGIVMAMLTGGLLRKTVLHGDSSPLLMELPSYHWPRVKTLGIHAWQRLKGFVWRAGKLIVPICLLLGVLGSLNVDGTLNGGEGSVNSLLSVTGRAITPVFAPMGIQADNWPAAVGLLTGVLAKEVVIGTLNTLYIQAAHLMAAAGDAFNFWGGLHEAMISVPRNLLQLGSALSNPVLAKAPVHTLSQPVYGVMYQQFGSQAAAIAYLLFVLLYFPCISTTAAMVREIGRGWAVFSVGWATGVAYGIAVIFYQIATWAQHPGSSLVWSASVMGVFVGVILAMRAYSHETIRRQYGIGIA